jgi:MYXO-CTERM domain-containing protein
MRDRHPRTAMGLTEDRGTFILAVVDGRDSPDSLGMYGSELAALMYDLGAWEAFNLDGGGSAAMWLQDTGYLNEPSDGSARAVANHWGVYAGADGGQPREPGSCFVPGGCFATALAGAEDEPFSDMPPGTYGHDEAAALLEAGHISGCSTDPRAFCPSCGVTRAQVATMVVNVAGLDTSTPPAAPTFVDVPVDHWSYAHVEAAVAAGWIEPCAPDMFCPDDPIARDVAASVVRQAAGTSDAAPDAPTFDDVLPGSPYHDDIAALSGACLLPACDGNDFCPEDPALRADAAIFIANAFALVPVEPCADAGTSGDDGSDASAGADTQAPDPDTSAGSSASSSAPSSETDPTYVGERGGNGDGCSCRAGTPAGLPVLLLLFVVYRRRRESFARIPALHRNAIPEHARG